MSVMILRTIKTLCVISVLITVVVEVAGLNGAHVCMVQQKYNITKRVKYRAPMSVRTYEWCFSMPPRCSKWNTELRDLTRLETEERTAEVAACCPGYKMRDVSCVPICPPGKTGTGCSEDCPINKWGPNCVYECKNCKGHGSCSPVTGVCRCREGWQGESCDMSMTTAAPTTEKIPLTFTTAATKASTSRTLPNTTTLTTASTTTSTATTRRNIFITSTPESLMSTSTKASTTSAPRTKTTDKPSTINRSISTVMKPIQPTTLTTLSTLQTKESKMTQKLNIPLRESYNRTEVPTTKKTPLNSTLPTTATTFLTTVPTTTVTYTLKTETIKPKEIMYSTTVPTKDFYITESFSKMSTKKTETVVKIYPTTVKFKPKEIWIRPAQKGESSIVETKIKPNSEVPQSKQVSATKKEISPVNTTPRTIIVSIIPTSMSYATFKKIALTTASYFPFKSNSTLKSSQHSTDQAFTNAMSSQTSSTPFVKISNSTPKSTSSATINPFLKNATIFKSHTYTTKGHTKTTLDTRNATNSMTSTLNAVNTKPNSSLTTSSTNASRGPRTYKIPTTTEISITTPLAPKRNRTTIAEKLIVKERNLTNTGVTNVPIVTRGVITKGIETNITKPKPTNIVTESPEDEVFHILTEPEHITAVMGEREPRSSVDLVSVMSIAGGVMMTVITVAVVIVMVERCKRPRYEDVNKMNSIRMQVMIDNNDGPPPYVRSIFNTPLPEPPSSEKCHYQPISTLDRNLKQFMRPVVVQTISPMMLENFRGILECHYDHLPRRSQEFPLLQARCSLTPSNDCSDELRYKQADSLAESTIEALKCEAKMDIIDNTTSEPLYAEIPCWRPPSEHAIEIINLNGEAMTEL